MSIGSFLGGLFGGQNTFSAQPMQLDKFDYNKGLQAAQEASISNLNAGEQAGQMQKSLAQQLMEQSQAAPTGPSVAEMQLKKAADQNIKNQAALLASRRGINPAQAARGVAMLGASTGQDLANQAAQLRANEEIQRRAEQFQKQQLLSQALQSQRGQDIGLLGAQTGFYGTAGQLAGAQQGREMENYWNAQKINADIAKQNAEAAGKIGGGLLGGIAGAAAGPLGGMISNLFSSSGGGGGGGGGGMLGSNPRFGLGGNFQFAQGGRVGDGGSLDENSPNPEMSRVLVSPGEKVVNPDGKVMKVPGKAEYSGDDERNDTVIADLRKDAVVIPRSKSDNKEKMIEFLKHVKESSKKKSDLQMLLDSHNELKQKLDEMNYKMGKWSPK